MKHIETAFNIEAVESKILNYFVQAQVAEKFCKYKRDTDTININVVELGKQAVKEHKDIHKLVASKMFDIKYEDVTEEQRRMTKTLNFRYIYDTGLI